MSKTFILSSLFTFLVFPLSSQPDQLMLDRVAKMPLIPNPYEIRDWKQVTGAYDTLIFTTSDGIYFPLLTIGSSGVNFPEIEPIFFDSYVGSAFHGQQREAINIIPSIIGPSLLGIDKTTQFGVNWVEKVKDFYNLNNGELVYLNGPSDQSGNDWWYETMPNVFFYQLFDLYPSIPDFALHFEGVANRWLQAVEAMGGASTPWSIPNMNFRAWNLKEMRPLNEGVKEPEAAGAIAWILYQAYRKNGDNRYLVGAQWAMEFLNSLEENPSYELQLPYGVLAAALMNAELGTDYDIEKMLNWCFERGNLRGWGAVIGEWDGKDVAGLIGEANDQGNDYVFAMNGFQQAAALVPLMKYDKRFTRIIAKWMLNVSNASRLFYAQYIGEGQQSDYAWSFENDPNSSIAYEAIKENWQGIRLYARGDARDAGWAETNLSLYGSSHVGYLASIVEKTDVDGILQLDVNATDFFSENPFPTFAYFNPFVSDEQVTIKVGDEPIDIYDVISESILMEGAVGSVLISVPANEAILVSCIPTGANLETAAGRLLADGHILDYHHGYDFSPKIRIKSLAYLGEKAELGTPADIFCTPGSYEGITFHWWVNGVKQSTSGDILDWTPEVLGTSTIKVRVGNETETAEDSILINVVELIPETPIIDSLWTRNSWQEAGQEIWVYSSGYDPKNLELEYEWSFPFGEIVEEYKDSIKIRIPESPGVYALQFSLSNTYALRTEERIELLVLEKQPHVDPLIYLPMNGNTRDYGGSEFETVSNMARFTADPKGKADHCLLLANDEDEVRIINSTALNFDDQISVSCWIYFNDASEERFIVSHGSWEKRWKLSLITNQKLRWTINTTSGIVDLDSSFPLQKEKWYHVVSTYSGTVLQLYIDGKLNTFSGHSGEIRPSDTDLTIGKRLPGDVRYFWKGRIDEVRIYDQWIGPEQALSLQTEWLEEHPLALPEKKPIRFFPNPSSGSLQLTGDFERGLLSIEVTDMTGKKYPFHQIQNDRVLFDPLLPKGVYVISLFQNEGVIHQEKLVIN